VRTANGDDLLARALSVVHVGGSVEGAVVLERQITSRREVALARAPRLLATLAILIGVAAVVSLVVGRRVVGRPVDALAAKAERAGRGDFGGPLVLRQSDELGDLARAMNQMCADLAESSRMLASEVDAREQALNQLRRADRLMTVGRLAAGLAHELGTPINVVSERIKMAAAGEIAPDDVPRNNQRMLEQLDRMARIIRQLLDFARQRSPEKTDADLVKLLRHVADLLRPLAEKASVSVVLEASDGPATAKVDTQQIEQAVSNLLVNAFQAMPQGGVVALRLRHDPGGFCIEVVDHGTGIASSDLVRIFEPFFTTKDVGEGTGLGLSVVHSIVEEHGGQIEVDSEPGRGSTFRVLLPAGGLA
jgi:signal transduction histidine kinase